MNKQTKIIILIGIIFILGIIAFFFPSPKEDFDKGYETNSDKELAKLIESSVSSIYLSQQKEFNSNLQNLSVKIKLKGIKKICFTGAYGFTENTLELANLNWKYLKLWESRKYDEGWDNGLVADILLVKNNEQIIPILLNSYSYKLIFNKDKCKSDRGSTSCNVSNESLQININSSKIKNDSGENIAEIKIVNGGEE